MNGVVVKYEKFKEGVAEKKQVTNYYDWESKILEPYEDIVDGF